MRVMVTGGAGFIGSALVRHLVLDKGYDVLNVDALTYAGNLASLRDGRGQAQLPLPEGRHLRSGGDGPGDGARSGPTE